MGGRKASGAAATGTRRGPGGPGGGMGRGGGGGGRRTSAREKAAALRQAEARRARRRRAGLLTGTATVIAALVTALGFVLAHRGAAADHLDTGRGLLASTRGQATGETVDGAVRSDSAERIRYHVHAHLTVFVGNRRMAIPYGIGIVPPYRVRSTAGGPFVEGGRAFYFLHTHDESGILHVESPDVHSYTLRNFFDVWRQPLGTGQVGPYKGAVTVYVDGRPYAGDPGGIVLSDHEQIQLDVGSRAAFVPFSWPQGY